MVRRLTPFVALALALGACQVPPPAATAPTGAPAARAGELVVGFAPETPEADRAALRQRFGADAAKPVASNAEWWRVPAGQEGAAIAALGAAPGVRYARPNLTRRLVEPAAGPGAVPAPAFKLAQNGEDLAPNDPLFPRQWHHKRVRFPQAWESTTGKGVIVAVIDSGVDPGHPDLKAHLLPMIDEVVAFNRHDVFNKQNFDGRDGHGHGTHVCGLVGALKDNGIGVVGGAPDATILPIKVTANDGETDDATIAKGITDAVAGKAKVLNLSIGGPEPSPLLLEALNDAFVAGATVVIAAGNDGLKVNYPAAYPGVIAVGGLTALDGVATYSSRGDDLVLLAPGGGAPGMDEGEQVYSCTPTYDCYLTTRGGKPKDYGGQAGTSMAAPLVSALAALVMAKDPALTGAQVRTRLAATCEDMQAPGFDITSGWGLINAEKAVSP